MTRRRIDLIAKPRGFRFGADRGIDPQRARAAAGCCDCDEKQFNQKLPKAISALAILGKLAVLMWFVSCDYKERVSVESRPEPQLLLGLRSHELTNILGNPAATRDGDNGITVLDFIFLNGHLSNDGVGGYQIQMADGVAVSVEPILSHLE